jgi:AcrR family transcriptional regulator
MRSGTRERIVETTAELFRRHGYTGNGLKQIVAEANAPFGSIYHHFPNGKAQLGEEVIRSSGRMYFELFEAIFEAAPDVVSATGDFFVGAAETLRQTDYADACPIATVALEVASTNEPLRLATDRVFTSWTDALATRLRRDGLDDAGASSLAITVVAALEGGFLLARAGRDGGALRAVGGHVASLVERELTAVRS